MSTSIDKDIHRGDRVLSPDSPVGWVTHVIVNPAAQAVTDLVVTHDGREWLVPFSAVATVRDHAVELRAPWSAIPVHPFDRREFQETPQAPDMVWRGRESRAAVTSDDSERTTQVWTVS